jgi:hypothetical protein
VIAATAADAVPTFLSQQPDESVASPVACILLDCRLIKSHPFAVPAFDQRLIRSLQEETARFCLLIAAQGDRLSDRRQADASARSLGRRTVHRRGQGAPRQSLRPPTRDRDPGDRDARREPCLHRRRPAAIAATTAPRGHKFRVYISPARDAASPRRSNASCAGVPPSNRSSARRKRSTAWAETTSPEPTATPPTPSSPPPAATSAACSNGICGNSSYCLPSQSRYRTLGALALGLCNERRESRIRAAARGRAAAATGSTIRVTNLRPAPPRRRLGCCLGARFLPALSRLLRRCSRLALAPCEYSGNSSIAAAS